MDTENTDCGCGCNVQRREDKWEEWALEQESQLD